MSLAMQEDFAERAGAQIEVLVHDIGKSEKSSRLIDLIDKNTAFTLLVSESSNIENELALVSEDRYRFLLTIDEGFSEQLSPTAEETQTAVVRVTVAPSASKQNEMIFRSIVLEAIARMRLEELLDGFSGSVSNEDASSAVFTALDSDAIFSLDYGYESSGQHKAPTSVQQSVPAWLVFSLFFVVVPLSNTFVNERALGTMRRIKTINVNSALLIVGKLVPYFFINQIQVVLMLLVGVFLVPMLGGGKLTLGESPEVLALVSVGISCAALGYAMLIAVVAKTAEHATTLGGTGNIVLAAIGGIMVPTFVMPEFMQKVSALSPMNWGLEGFLDVLLRGGGVAEVLPETMALMAFGGVALLLAMILFFLNDG